MQDKHHDPRFEALLVFLAKVPGITPGIGCDIDPDGHWWVKFGIDIAHPLAWHVVQEFGHVLNYLSLNEPLPSRFLPVSAPPYMNGGPADFLAWIIENTHPAFTPALAAEWLEGRLPQPVDDLSQWVTDHDDD
ncbi:MAG TPA: hypothetical protein DDZ22_20360 [Massilia sp.]|nr:hypothetical protein [Massilia sp.]